jgi:type I restriction-modification system DNA methylase subunit
MVDILEPYKGRVFDPCCGSGGMFVQCSKFVKEHQGRVDDIAIYGQESNPGTWKMAKMNLAIRGLEGNLGEKNGDSSSTAITDLSLNLRPSRFSASESSVSAIANPRATRPPNGTRRSCPTSSFFASSAGTE